jgi:hypothetical protein
MPFTPSLATPIFILNAGLFGDNGALGVFGDDGVAGLFGDDGALGVFGDDEVAGLDGTLGVFWQRRSPRCIWSYWPLKTIHILQERCGIRVLPSPGVFANSPQKGEM